MTISGTTSFNLDLVELVEEAFERVGAELRTGYDLKTARRSLNLLFADWANRGINMWTFEQVSIPLVAGQSTYALPNNTVDLLEHVIRTGAGNAATQADLTITRISVSTYATLPNKLTQARPIQVLVQRNSGETAATGVPGSFVNGPLQLGMTATSTDTTLTIGGGASDPPNLPVSGFVRIGSEIIYYSAISRGGVLNQYQLTGCARGQQGTVADTQPAGATIFLAQIPAITVWPVPDASQTYTFVYWRMKRIDDAGDGTNTMAVPFRFIPCMVAGLAYYLALKVPGGLERLMVLKQQYDEAWQMAADEDREKASVRFVPRQQFIN